VEKLLEDAQIKVSVVATGIFGVSGRDMLAALVSGERDPKVLAQLARRSLRKKISLLEDAFTGRFTDHHAFLLARMLHRVDAITADIAALDARIEEEIAPFAAAVRKIDEVPGISLVAAHAILAEIGLDMTRFPTAGHLVSWAKYAPGVQESAGKKKGKNSTGHGNPYLAAILGNAAAAAAKTGTFLGDRYRRIARRRGSRKANVAVGRSILVIIWHLLSDPDAAMPTSDPTTTSAAPTRPPQARTRPPARSTRLHRHSRTRCLITRTLSPAPRSSARRCRAPRNCPIFGLAVSQSSESSPAFVGAKPHAPK
jgi:transposase